MALRKVTISKMTFCIMTFRNISMSVSAFRKMPKYIKTFMKMTLGITILTIVTYHHNDILTNDGIATLSIDLLRKMTHIIMTLRMTTFSTMTLNISVALDVI